MYASSTGSLGAGHQAQAGELGQLLIQSNRAAGATDPRNGERFTWGRLIRKLLDAANDYREARDNFRAKGMTFEADDAEQSRARVIAVYDELAELYREWPDLGLDERGALNGLPVPLIAIAGIIGGAAVWWWAVGQAFQAGRLLILSREASSACDVDPEGERCRQAREDVREAEKTLQESGVSITGGGFGALGLVAGVGLALYLMK